MQGRISAGYFDDKNNIDAAPVYRELVENSTGFKMRILLRCIVSEGKLGFYPVNVFPQYNSF